MASTQGKASDDGSSEGKHPPGGYIILRPIAMYSATAAVSMSRGGVGCVDVIDYE